jgi:hypothetical protein
MRPVALNVLRTGAPGTGQARVDTAPLSRLNDRPPLIATPTAMRRFTARVALPLVVAALAASATAAQAAICFVIHDAKDTVVYRDWVPPFDGALDYASPEREALRQRGLHFSYFDAPVCQQVAGAIGPGGAKASTVDAIVAAIPDYRLLSRGGVTGSSDSGGGASSGMPAATGGSGPVNRARSVGTSASGVSYR